MTRPTPLPLLADGIPEALLAEGRWVVWRYVQRDGLWTKLPFQASGAMAKANDPATWCSFGAALAAYRAGGFDGIGFVLGDGWAGIDMDDCCAQGGFTLIDAVEYLRALRHTYVEKSPSGTGVKAIGRSSRIGGEIAFKADPPTFTGWSGARFFAITGLGAGNPLGNLSAFIDEWFPAPIVQSSAREGYALAAESTDDDLLNAMIANDSNGDAILMLWRGDTSAYGGDQSRADQALVCHLAFWTNFDAERIDRMFRQSGLMRPKWDHASYRRATIGKALR